MGRKTVLYIIVTFLITSISGQKEPARNISCLSCHDQSPPSFGCLDRLPTTLEDIANKLSDLYTYRGQDVVKGCHMCAIQDVWDLTSKDFVGNRRKLCFVTNITDKCTFDFPVGTKHVVQTCRCKTELCNIGDITDIGGHAHIDKFPKKPEPPKTAKKSSGFKLQPFRVQWLPTLIFIVAAFQTLIIVI